MEAIPTLLVACTAAHALRVLLLRRSILTEKVARRGTLVAREYAADPFSLARVADVMDEAPPVVVAGTTVAELAAEGSTTGSPLAVRQGTIVGDEEGRLAGIIKRGDASVLDAGTRASSVATPDESVHEALSRMLRTDVGRLPVVDRADPRRVAGYLGRAGILEAHASRAAEARVRERSRSTAPSTATDRTGAGRGGSIPRSP